MNKPVPSIHESSDELNQRLAHERPPAKHQCLDARAVLARGQARFRNDLTQLLGVGRNTGSRWLDRYAPGGLAVLLDRYVPAGNPPALRPGQCTQRAQAL
jgi:transposase